MSGPENTPWQGRVEEAEEGLRLDRFLAARLSEESRNRVVKAIREGLVTIDEEPCQQPSRRLRTGQTVRYMAAPRESLDLVPEDIPLSLAYEDDWLAVIRKPAGMVVHPAHGHPDGTLVNALLGRWGGGAVGDDEVRPGIVHRLDKGTSGLLVVARTPAVMAALQEQFAQRRVKKGYLALIAGVCRDLDGGSDMPLTRHPSDRKRFTGSLGKGRSARTSWRTICQGLGVSLLAVRLHTGRTHQIRVHLAEGPGPILGDDTYGGRWFKRIGDSRERNLCRRARRPLLHAALLEFTHPHSGERMRFAEPPPGDMTDLSVRLFGAEAMGSCLDIERLSTWFKEPG